jgi:hypothetical protein
MKNRRRTITAFILIACLVMGLGYAALTDVLDITGTAEITAGNAQAGFDEDIYFESAEALQHTTAAVPDSAEVLSNNDNAYFYSNNLATAGDTASFKFVIRNDSDLEVTITPTLTSADGANTNTEWFSLVSDWAGQPKTVAANSSIEYTVTITLLKTPTLETGEVLTGKFGVTLTAVAADNTTVNG